MNARRLVPLGVVAALAACADLALEADRIPASIELLPRTGLFAEGETVKLDVIALDQHGKEMRIPSWGRRWTVSDTTIVQVAPDGTMSTVGGGEVNVRVTVGKLKNSSRFRVNPSQVDLSAVIYLNQAAQNRNAGVELVPGRAGLLRVFVVGDQTSYFKPSVRITLYEDGTEVLRETIPARSDSTSRKVIEAGLDHSYNVPVPAHLVHGGVRMVVELDPEGVVPLGPGAQTRYPPEGSMPFPLVEPPLLRQIMVPTIATLTPHNGALNWTSGINPLSQQVRMTRTLLPEHTMEVEVHDTYTTGTDLRADSGWFQYIDEINVLFVDEGRRGYYYGVVALNGAAIGGLGFIGYPVSVGLPIGYIYTHELGHNMNLRHAPCGNPGGPDPFYPYREGSIGIWGYDAAGDRLLDPDVYNDVMGYCGNQWISDYHFSKAMAHRLDGDGGVILDGPEASGDAGEGEMLVVWGRIAEGRAILDPSFVLDGPVSLPDESGPYRVEGIGADGRTEFSISFSPTPRAYGGAGFVFFVPWEPEWAGTLDRMVLTGPEGTYTLARSDSPPMAVVTDRSDGTIRAIIRRWDGGTLPGEESGQVTVTRGIPGGVGR